MSTVNTRFDESAYLEHPNSGVQIFQVIGRERRFGYMANVEERPQIRGPLSSVVEESFSVLSRLLRRPSRLMRDGTFRQTTEYPDFAWQEAILNALAHRDYSVHSRSIEAWLFDDRFEVKSPGGLVPGVSCDSLLAGHCVHSCRNPELLRSMVERGYIRGQGLGFPRLRAELAGQFLPSPELVMNSSELCLTLRNTMVISADDREFIDSLQTFELSEDEFRVLLEVNWQTRVDDNRVQTVLGLDMRNSKSLLRSMHDRGLLMEQWFGTLKCYVLGEAFREDVGAGAVSPESSQGTTFNGQLSLFADAHERKL